MKIVNSVILAALSFGQTWVDLGTAGDGTILLGDVESVATEGDHVSAWVKLDFSNVKTEPNRYSVQQWRFDCPRRTAMVVSTVNYLPNGKVSSSDSKPSDNRYYYQPVPPGTLFDTVMKDICARVWAQTP